MSERQRTSRRARLLFAVVLVALGLPAQTAAQNRLESATSVVSGASQALQARTAAPIAATAAAPMPLGARALTAA
ncbi:MAG: hypothetical protein ACRED5_07210, partial [Propylenella sp.]